MLFVIPGKHSLCQRHLCTAWDAKMNRKQRAAPVCRAKVAHTFPPCIAVSIAGGEICEVGCLRKQHLLYIQFVEHFASAKIYML